MRWLDLPRGSGSGDPPWSAPVPKFGAQEGGAPRRLYQTAHEEPALSSRQLRLYISPARARCRGVPASVGGAAPALRRRHPATRRHFARAAVAGRGSCASSHRRIFAGESCGATGRKAAAAPARCLVRRAAACRPRVAAPAHRATVAGDARVQLGGGDGAAHWHRGARRAAALCATDRAARARAKIRAQEGHYLRLLARHGVPERDLATAAPRCG